MSELQTLLGGLAFGESPRWHQDRLWFANWGTRQIVAVDLAGASEVVTHIPTTLPYSIDWLPDGRMLVVSGREARLLRLEPDGSLAAHAELPKFGGVFNEIVVDSWGNAYVNGANLDPSAGQDSASGVVVLVRPDGSVRTVADRIAFGNGMVITADGATLIVAESWANQLTAFDIGADGSLTNRRVWADLGDGFPDGICLDADNAVWYADVPNQRCVRVLEGGQVLQVIDVDRGCFACMLGGPGRRTLFILASVWRGFEHMADEARDGQLLTVQAPAAGVGRP